MSYVGGKHRIRKELTALIVRECRRLGTSEVWEPFCGGLNVTAALGRVGVRVHASDLSEHAIVLYRAILLGWTPPAAGLTQEQWARLKVEFRAGKKHPLLSYAGFCGSFNSVFFASYAPVNEIGNFRTLKRRVRAARFSSLNAREYTRTSPPPGSVIYCDPPYADTDMGAYRALPKQQRVFDNAAFWDWCRARRGEGSTVLVSEYVAPDDAELLWYMDLPLPVAAHAGAQVARESVFVYRSTEQP